MDVFYKIGVIIGILAIYLLVTIGLGCLVTVKSYDDMESLACSYVLGLIAFIVLTIFTMTKLNLWGSV